MWVRNYVCFCLINLSDFCKELAIRQESCEIPNLTVSISFLDLANLIKSTGCIFNPASGMHENKSSLSQVYAAETNQATGWSRDLSLLQCIQSSCEATRPPAVPLYKGQTGRSTKLASHFNVVLRVRMNGANPVTPPLPQSLHGVKTTLSKGCSSSAYKTQLLYTKQFIKMSPVQRH